MYVSSLLIDVGDNPDRPRPGRQWLRNIYHVHQRLCMAFPNQPQRTNDPHFLAPYQPCGFPDPRPAQCSIKLGVSDALRPCSVLAEQAPLHVPRDNVHNFLFRIDPQPGNRVVILVQSALPPDWDYAFQNARYLLAAAPSEPRHQIITLEVGTRWQFRLLANTVRRVSKKSVDAEGRLFDPKWVEKRVPVPATEEHLRDWLERRAEPRWSPPKNSEQHQFPPGFRLVKVSNIQPGYVYGNKTRDSAKGQRFRSARYDGILEVTHSGRFRETVVRGMGPGKAFGFGLLSIAPSEGPP